jgi:predicted Ser/Thr protein kinase
VTPGTFIRQALLPAASEPWPTGVRRRWLYLGRVAAMPVTIIGNVFLWLGLRNDPAVHRDVANLFLLVNNGLLCLNMLVTFLTLRRALRWTPVVIVGGCLIEIGTSLIWIQMTGSLTSYFLGTLVMLILIYRFVVNYWAGLAAMLASIAGITACYVLEELGIQRRSSLFVHDITVALLPDVYRSTALISITTSVTIIFVLMNVFARALEGSRAALEEARAELAAVVDEARLGRLSGSQLGRYELRELLGRGGMGEVYQARAPDGSPVACKVLHAHLGADTAARTRFRREAELVQRLPAHCAARVLEVGTSAGAEYIAMERLVGEDLAAYLRRRGRLSVAETVTLTRSIADALDAAHAVGVIHRDLKPSNVFLVGERVEDTRLLDFGIARLYEGVTSVTLTETTAVLGSPGYMPPEQAAADHAAIGPPTDVFALGAIVYRALTGEPAFPSRNPAAAIFEAMHHRPPAPSGLAPLPVGIDRLCGVALAKDPRQRFASPGELAAALERAAVGDPLDELAERATGVAGAAPATPTLTAAPGAA